MTNTFNVPELVANHGKKADLRISAYRDLDALRQAQNAMTLLSELTSDMLRDTTITQDEIAAVARYAGTYLDQWLDAVHEAPIGELC